MSHYSVPLSQQPIIFKYTQSLVLDSLTVILNMLAKLDVVSSNKIKKKHLNSKNG